MSLECEGQGVEGGHRQSCSRVSFGQSDSNLGERWPRPFLGGSQEAREKWTNSRDRRSRGDEQVTVWISSAKVCEIRDIGFE